MNIKDIYNEIEKCSKLRGRALRNIRMFLANKKGFLGHATPIDVETFIKGKQILSAAELIKQKKLIAKEGFGDTVKNVLDEVPLAYKKKYEKFLKQKIDTVSTSAESIMSEHKFGKSGILVPFTNKIKKKSAFVSPIGNEVTVARKIEIPKGSIFLTGKDKNYLNKKYPKETIIKYKDFEKKFPNYIIGNYVGGNQIKTISPQSIKSLFNSKTSTAEMIRKSQPLSSRIKDIQEAARNVKINKDDKNNRIKMALKYTG